MNHTYMNMLIIQEKKKESAMGKYRSSKVGDYFQYNCIIKKLCNHPIIINYGYLRII